VSQKKSGVKFFIALPEVKGQGLEPTCPAMMPARLVQLLCQMGKL